MENTEQGYVCAAAGRGCGTATGWTNKGRCPRCRAAHNDETNRYRGLSAQQRAEVLSMLRAGYSPEQAATAVGKTKRSLSAAAVADGELRLALDGRPSYEQSAARCGDYLAALTRNGGNRWAAARAIGVDESAPQTWARADPLFAQAEKAVLAWLKNNGIKPRRKVSETELEYAAQLLEDGATVSKAGKAIGVSPAALHYNADRLPRLAAALPQPRQGPPQIRNPYKLTSDVEQEFRAMWADKNWTVQEISEHLRIGRQTVYRWRQLLGLPSRQPRRTIVPNKTGRTTVRKGAR